MQYGLKQTEEEIPLTLLEKANSNNMQFNLRCRTHFERINKCLLPLDVFSMVLSLLLLFQGF